MDTNTYMPVAPVGNGFGGDFGGNGWWIILLFLFAGGGFGWGNGFGGNAGMTHTLKSIATLEAMRSRRPRYEEYRRY